MKAPHRITLDEYLDQANPYRDGDDHCPKCRTHFKAHPCYVSIHTLMFEQCAGQGRVIILHIPYCPVCEAVPDERGCLHV